MTCVLGDPFFSSVVLLCHMDGTNGSFSFSDSSNSAHTITTGGTGTVVSTAHPKFGTGAADYTSATNDYLETTTTVTDFNFGNNPFTIEAWGYVQSGLGRTNGIIGASWGSVAGNSGWAFFIFSNALLFQYTTDGTTVVSLSTAYTPPTNTWVFFTADRDTGHTLRTYVNGVVFGSVAANATFFASTAGCRVGNIASSPTLSWSGQLDDVRITKGVARYGGAFTPPTVVFPNTAANVGCAGGLMFRGVGSLAFPSPGLVAALGGARAILRNKPTTRRGLLRPWQ